MADAGLASYDARAESGIGPQQGVGGELWDQVFAERLRGQVVEDRVIGDFLPVAHDKYRNLPVEPDASPAGGRTAATRGADGRWCAGNRRGSAARPLVRSAEERFIGLDNAVQLRGFALRRGREKAVVPAERRARRSTAGHGRLAHAERMLQCRREAKPNRFVAQPRRQRAGQRIEGSQAAAAPIALQPMCDTPFGYLRTVTLGALNLIGFSIVGQSVRRRRRQCLPLRCTQRAKLTQKRCKGLLSMSVSFKRRINLF